MNNSSETLPTTEQQENLTALNRTARKEAWAAMLKLQARLNKLRRKPKVARKWKHSDPQYGQKLALAMQKKQSCES